MDSAAPHESKFRSSDGRRLTPVAVCVVILTVCAVGAIATALRPVVTPLLIGLMLFFLVSPFVQRLDDRHLPRWVTYVILCLITGCSLAGFGWLIASQGAELREQLPGFRERGREVLDRYAQMVGIADAEGHLDQRLYSVEQLIPISQADVVGYVLEGTVELLELTTMAFFYLLFALMESQHFPRRISQNLSVDSGNQFGSVIESIKTQMWRYLTVKTAVSAGLGVTVAILGWSFGLSFWILWGSLVFLSNYITYIGSIISLAPPILLAFVQFDSLIPAIALTTLLIATRLVWVDYAEMRYSGKNVNVSPLLVLFSVALFGWMWGVVGMLLAVPLITIARTLLEQFPSTQIVARLMSDSTQS